MTKGEITKQKIIEAAKEEFFEKGYINVTVKSITEKLGGRPSWISYHFRYKDNIVSEIFNEYINKIEALVGSYNHDIKDSMLHEFIVQILINQGIFALEENTRFYLECMQHKSNYRFFFIMNYSIETYTKIAKEYNVHLVNYEIESLAKIEAAGRRELFLDRFIEHHDSLSISEFINLNMTISVRMMGIDPNLINQNLLTAWKICDSIQINNTGINLLK